MRLSFLTLVLLFPTLSPAQDSLKIDWHYHFSPNMRSDAQAFVPDQQGNHYAISSFNPSGYEKLGNDSVLFRTNGRTGMLAKINDQGKMEWYRVIRPRGLRVNIPVDVMLVDVAVSPMGDVLVIGNARGLTLFPSIGDTLKKGTDPTSQNWQDGAFAFMISYSAEGKINWYRECSHFDHADRIVCNSKGEIFLKTHYNYSLVMDGKTIDEIKTPFSAERMAILKLDARGHFRQVIKKWEVARLNHFGNLFEEGKLSRLESLEISIDKKDHFILTGHFIGNLELSNKVTLRCKNKYTDSGAQFIARYDPDFKLLWQKKIGSPGGRYYMLKPAFDRDNNVYIAGNYSTQCIISDGVTEINRSQAYKVGKSGASMYYAKINEDGTLAFVTYHMQKIDYNHCAATALVVDDQGYTHLFGDYTDSLQFSPSTGVLFPGKRTDTLMSNDNPKEIYLIHTKYKAGCFYSVWHNDEVLFLQDIADLSPATTAPQMTKQVYYEKGNLFYGGFFYKGFYLLDGKKKISIGKKNFNSSIQLICKTTPPVLHSFGRPLPDTARITLKEKNRTLENTRQPAEKTPAPPLNQNNMDSMVTVKLYPNPFKDQASISINGLTGNVRTDIVTSEGKIVFSQMFLMETPQQTFNFDFSHFVTGTYYLVVTQGEVKRTVKMVKID